MKRRNFLAGLCAVVAGLCGVKLAPPKPKKIPYSAWRRITGHAVYDKARMYCDGTEVMKLPDGTVFLREGAIDWTAKPEWIVCS